MTPPTNSEKLTYKFGKILPTNPENSYLRTRKNSTYQLGKIFSVTI